MQWSRMLMTCWDIRIDIFDSLALLSLSSEMFLSNDVIFSSNSGFIASISFFCFCSSWKQIISTSYTKQIITSNKKCNLTLKRAHLPVTWRNDSTQELQLAIVIMYRWNDPRGSSLNFGSVTDSLTDRMLLKKCNLTLQLAYRLFWQGKSMLTQKNFFRV